MSQSDLDDISDSSFTDWVLSRGTAPRVHGNGFVQLDLPGGRRLHVWGHPGVPRQTSPTLVHDHRFAFTSWVLVGTLLNVEYTLTPPASYLLPKYVVMRPVARVGEDTRLEPDPEESGLHSLYARRYDVVRTGQFYSVVPRVLHETFYSEPTVTMILKTGLDEGYVPRVLCPEGERPDNDFERYSVVTEERLREIVREALEPLERRRV